MSIVPRKDSKNKYMYRSIRENGRVRKVYLGVVGGPSVQLAHRVQQLSKAIQTSERAKRAAETRMQKQTAPALRALADFAVRWRCLESLFKALPDWDRTQLLNAPYGWAGDFAETLKAARRILMSKRRTPKEFKELLKAVENNDPDAIEVLARQAADERELFAAAVDLVEISRKFVVDALSESSPLSRLAVEAKVDSTVDDLGRDKAQDGLERILIDITAVTYMNAMKCHAFSARATDTQQGAKFWASMASSTNKDLTATIKSLDAYRTRLRRRRK